LASPLVRELLDAGIHFGHRCSRWNPRMAPYLYGKRNAIHIIDIRETLRGLLRAKRFVSRVVAQGGDVLFVGTKRQAREIVQRHAERCGMHWVTERWLGGTLTNFRTIRSRLQRLDELENLVGSPQWESGYSKKMKSTLSRELQKIRRNLDGIRRMARPPAATVLIDVRKEINAVRESRALGIPTICLIDSDSDPSLVDIVIPGNDDAMRAIELIVRELADAVEEGKKSRPRVEESPDEREPGGGAGRLRRRQRRGPVEPRGEQAGTAAEGRGVETPGAVAGPVPAQVAGDSGAGEESESSPG
jgi:small subunit ribosomal protein S2